MIFKEGNGQGIWHEEVPFYRAVVTTEGDGFGGVYHPSGAYRIGVDSETQGAYTHWGAINVRDNGDGTYSPAWQGGEAAPFVWYYDNTDLLDLDYDQDRAWVGGVEYSSIAAARDAGAIVVVNGLDTVNIGPYTTGPISFIATGINSNPGPSGTEVNYLFSIDDGNDGVVADNLLWVGEQFVSPNIQIRASASNASTNYSSLVHNAPSGRGVLVVQSGIINSGDNGYWHGGWIGLSNSTANFPNPLNRLVIGNRGDGIRPWDGTVLRIRLRREATAADKLIGHSALYHEVFQNMTYSWWIKDQCEVRDGIMYFTGVGRHTTPITALRMFIAAVNVETGLLVDYKTLYTNYALDDHNAPGFKFLDNGALLVIYTGHNDDGIIRGRYSSDGTIAGLGSEFTVSTLTETSYTQIQEFGTRVLNFCRETVNTWQGMISDSSGQSGTWSNTRTLFTSNLQFYINATKVSEDEIRFFTYNHPEFGDNVIKLAFMTPSDGQVYSGSGALGDLYDVGAGTEVSTFSALTTIFTPPAGSCVRLLDANAAGTQLLLWETVNNQYADGSYYLYRYNGGGLFTPANWSKHLIGPAGASFANPATTYIGGACFDKSYVGEGVRIFVSHESGGTWFITRRTSTDNGDTWSSQTIESSSQKLIRPASPIGATDDRPVIWQDNIDYTTYTDFRTDIKWQ